MTNEGLSLDQEFTSELRREVFTPSYKRFHN